jgi:hypothetical protein
MTVHEATEHPWLCDDISGKDERFQQAIPNQRYHRLRDDVRKKYVSVARCREAVISWALDRLMLFAGKQPIAGCISIF